MLPEGMFGILIALGALFYALGKVTDTVVVNVRQIGDALQIRLYFLGILLGFFTSFPELSVGVSALVQGAPNIAVGNIFGGIMILFGLVLGGGAILNRRIKTDADESNMLPVLAFLFLPLLLGLDGVLGLMDGIVIILLYVGLLYLLVRNNYIRKPRTPGLPSKQLLRSFLYLIGGLALIVVLSNLIVRMVVDLLAQWQISTFFIGLVFFAIGTNLPEISITVRSWKRGVTDLPVSNLVGSAMSNIFILGLFAFFAPIYPELGVPYYLLLGFVFILFAAVNKFYQTESAYTRKEGVIMVAIYLAFVLSQFLFCFRC